MVKSSKNRIAVALMMIVAHVQTVTSFFVHQPTRTMMKGISGIHMHDQQNRVLFSEDQSIEKVTGTTTNAPDDTSLSFFDEASIYVRAGSGGQGSSTYKKAKKGQNGIPDGGAGGTGGNIILQIDDSLNTLAGLTPRGLSSSSKQHKPQTTNHQRLLSFRAEGGKDGGRMYDNGRAGADCFVRVPPGTVVSYEMEPAEKEEASEGEETHLQNPQDDQQEGEESGKKCSVEYNLHEIGTISFDEPALLVARGGRGGDGTASLKGSKKGKKRGAPTGGERFRLRLTLKLVADVAIVGVPNAGKSTFLAAVTKARPKIADYPFTTIIPNLGVWIPDDTSADYTDKSQTGAGGAAGSTGLVLCDVPGLIEGAADGVGLGHAFLRHVERCRVILHLIDATSQDPMGDYRMINREIQRYGKGNLSKMPQVVVVNKIDAWEAAADDEINHVKKSLEEKLKSEMPHSRLMWASAKEREGVDDLMTRMSAYVGKVKELQAAAEET